MSIVGIVMVTYNSEAVIHAALDAAIATGAQVVVVDNASRDGTVAEVARRGVHLIANPVNRGFGAAVNQGFAVLNCPYILLLNPDAVILRGLDALREACALPGAGAAGGCLINCDGTMQTGFMVRKFPAPVDLALESLLLNRVWPRNPWNRRYRCLDLDYSERLEVEQPAGAFLMVRRAIWEQLGGLDDRFYPLWFEDVDFCRRIAGAGYHLYYVPEAVAKHTGAHSIPHLAVEMRKFYWYCSLLRYSAKHFRPTAFRAVCFSVLSGSVLRSVGETARFRSLRPLAVYGKVVRLAIRCLLFGWQDTEVVSAPPL